MVRARPTLLFVALTGLGACVYPRHETPLLSVMHAPVDRATQPEGLWRVRLVSAHIPPLKRSGLAWDDDGSVADPYFTLRIDGRVRWETDPLENTLQPSFAQVSENLAFDRQAKVRIELWDKDSLGADPIGIYEGRAFSEAILGADTIIKLDSDASVTLRLERPEPKEGTGLAAYELRPDAVVVLEVTPNSPAARAHLRAGERILAIDGKKVSALAPQEVESALSLASRNKAALRVQQGKSQRSVKLDDGYVWPAH